MKTTSPELLHLQLQLPSDNLTLSLWLGEKNLFTLDYYISLSSFDYIFIADGQCDSPVSGAVTGTMETNDRSVSFLSAPA